MIRRNKKSPLLLNIVLLAFLVRSLIPVGFMPGQGASKLYPLVICSGYGQMTINVTADKLPYNPQAHDHGSMPCPFEQCLVQGAFGDLPELPRMQVASELALLYPAAYLASNITVKNYFSQGPPAFLA